MCPWEHPFSTYAVRGGGGGGAGFCLFPYVRPYKKLHTGGGVGGGGSKMAKMLRTWYMDALHRTSQFWENCMAPKNLWILTSFTNLLILPLYKFKNILGFHPTPPSSTAATYNAPQIPTCINHSLHHEGENRHSQINIGYVNAFYIKVQWPFNQSTNWNIFTSRK